MTIQNLDYKFREEYTKGELSKSDIQQNPFIQFENWFKEIVAVKEHAPNSVTLSTVSKDGRPSARIVLLKHFDEKGAVFYTDYNSRKAQQILSNPYVSMNLFCIELEREVRIEGRAEKISQAESEDYRHSRPFESQVAAYVSKQSSVLESRYVLEDAYHAALDTFKDKGDPGTDHWGGFRLVPEYFEFWQGREYRLHDRLVYTLQEDCWEISRLYP